MNNLLAKQLQYERDMWLRSLRFLEQESAYLKNRIAEVLKSDVDSHFLDEIESFQTSFINSDSLISSLKYELQEQDALLRNNNGNEDVFKRVLERHDKHHNKLQQIESEFSILKFKFNNYLDETFKIAS